MGKRVTRKKRDVVKIMKGEFEMSFNTKSPVLNTELISRIFGCERAKAAVTVSTAGVQHRNDFRASQMGAAH